MAIIRQECAAVSTPSAEINKTVSITCTANQKIQVTFDRPVPVDVISGKVQDLFTYLKNHIPNLGELRQRYTNRGDSYVDPHVEE